MCGSGDGVRVFPVGVVQRRGRELAEPAQAHALESPTRVPGLDDPGPRMQAQHLEEREVVVDEDEVGTRQPRHHSQRAPLRVAMGAPERVPQDVARIERAFDHAIPDPQQVRPDRRSCVGREEHRLAVGRPHRTHRLIPTVDEQGLHRRSENTPVDPRCTRAARHEIGAHHERSRAGILGYRERHRVRLAVVRIQKPTARDASIADSDPAHSAARSGRPST